MFTDGRSRRVVFLAHCLLNQNAISDGTAEVPAAHREILRTDPGRPGGRGCRCPARSCAAWGWTGEIPKAGSGQWWWRTPASAGPWSQPEACCPAAGADGSGGLADPGVPEARLRRAGHRRCGPLPLLRGEHHLGPGPGAARPGRVHRISPGGAGVGRADRARDRRQAVGAGGAGPGAVPSGRMRCAMEIRRIQEWRASGGHGPLLAGVP